jgi:hypothetical protein
LAVSVDILQLFPDLAAIDHSELQIYCDEWLQRPLARECGMAQIVIDGQFNMQVMLDEAGAVFHGDEVFIPIDELLGFIIDRHFTDANERRRLHAEIRDARKRWDELGKDYEATVGRVGTLYLVCKNPDCAAQMMSDKKAAQGQRINFGPMDITCTTCDQTFAYDGSDFKLKFD